MESRDFSFTQTCCTFCYRQASMPLHEIKVGGITYLYHKDCLKNVLTVPMEYDTDKIELACDIMLELQQERDRRQRVLERVAYYADKFDDSEEI